jgi:membrane associated rhomboid family serine protease
MRSYNNYPGQTGGFQIGPGTISPVIKYILIGTGAIFLIQKLSQLPIELVFGLTPALFYREFPLYIFQPLTYMFLHAGFFHIFFNMFTLWMFGTEIEHSWGSKSFLWFYLICGISGALFSLTFNFRLSHPIVGASGAIYGILAAYWLMFPDRYLLIFFIFPMKVRWAIPLFAVLNFVASGPNVAHLAHLGGALAGYIYVRLDWRIYRPGYWVKSLRHKRKTAKLEKNRQKAEEIMRRVDSILDKINEVGIENISKEDRKFLEEASHILSKNDKQLT